VRAEGQELLGWREVPTGDAALGPTAKGEQPIIRQVSSAGEGRRGRGRLRAQAVRDPQAAGEEGFALRDPGRSYFYVSSLSHKTIVYKGFQRRPAAPLYLDWSTLRSSRRSRWSPALLHQHLPSWRGPTRTATSRTRRDHTLRGNINWMHARQAMMRSKLFGKDLMKILTVVDTTGSDSAMFDNVLELLTWPAASCRTR